MSEAPAAAGSTADVVEAPPRPSAREFLRRAWSLDTRSLALFRVSLATLLLMDLAGRALELRMYYTDFGVLPRAAWQQLHTAGTWSLHALFGSTAMQVVLFLMAAAFAAMLFAGWHTRFATIASWLMLISLQNRVPAIESHGDTLLRLLLFWGIFLPLGARWSIDGARRGFVDESAGDDEYAVLTPATLALMLQIALVFACGYLLKNSPEWRSGRALLYALNMETWATTTGRGMLHFPQLLNVISRYALWADLLVPLLIFFPWKYQRVRTYTVIAVMLLQVLLAMMLRSGIFPFVLIAAMLALLPAWYWQTQERSAHFSDHIDFLLTEKFAQRSPRFSLPPFANWIAQGIAVLALVVVFAWNVAGVRGAQISPSVNRFMSFLRLDQRWDMLAPHPYMDEGWYVFPAQRAEIAQRADLKPDTLFDLAREGAPLRWNKPTEGAVFRQASSDRSMLYLAALHTDAFSAQRPLFAQYLCRDWNSSHPQARVSNVEVDFIRRINLSEHGSFAMARKYPLAKVDCQ